MSVYFEEYLFMLAAAAENEIKYKSLRGGDKADFAQEFLRHHHH